MSNNSNTLLQQQSSSMSNNNNKVGFCQKYFACCFSPAANNNNNNNSGNNNNNQQQKSNDNEQAVPLSNINHNNSGNDNNHSNGNSQGKTAGNQSNNNQQGQQRNNQSAATNNNQQQPAAAAPSAQSSIPSSVAALATQVSQGHQPQINFAQFQQSASLGNNPNRPPPGAPGGGPALINGIQRFLLQPLAAESYKKTLVLDLDETLVHSSFKPIPNADFVISIELENVIHRVYVRKRPGVDHFLRVVGDKWDTVIFTASLSKYADPLLDILDRNRVITARLFREACVQHYGNYVKDLTHLGRPICDSVIIDNSPFSYMFQPENAIPITSWFNDKNDRELYELLPFLDELLHCSDVVEVLNQKKLQICNGNSANMMSLSTLRAGLGVAIMPPGPAN